MVSSLLSLSALLGKKGRDTVAAGRLAASPARSAMLAMVSSLERRSWLGFCWRAGDRVLVPYVSSTAAQKSKKHAEILRLEMRREIRRKRKS